MEGINRTGRKSCIAIHRTTDQQSSGDYSPQAEKKCAPKINEITNFHGFPCPFIILFIRECPCK